MLLRDVEKFAVIDDIAEQSHSKSCAEDISPVSELQRLERFQHPRDRLLQLVNNWNNPLTRTGNVWWEQHLCGYMTLVYNCKIPFQLNREEVGRAIGDKVTVTRKAYVLIIFDAKIPVGAHCNNWDDESMLVEDVEVMKRPDGIIPIRVGSDALPNEIADIERNLVFRFTKGGFKFLPVVTDWKCCPFVRGSPEANYSLLIENIKSTSEVVNSVTNDYGSLTAENFILVDCEAKVVLPCMKFDAHVVRIEIGQSLCNRIEFEDVLLGPLNL